mmetsp:Transcript_12500/g.30768  ORF Transcript_12500/g.30768 Transcript_12500/m.30768 type:complete len:290 (-) Transcript_12500:852-1721(-)
MELFFCYESFIQSKVGTIPHASRDCVAMEHPGRNFISWRPGVAIGVGPALVSFPQISVLGLYVPFHCLSDDYVTHFPEVAVFRVLSSKFGGDKFRTSLLEQLEQAHVFHHCHLYYLRNAVANPALMQSLEKGSIRESQHGRMICPVDVLVPIPIAAGARRRSSIDPGDDRSAQHNIRSVAVVERASEAAKVGNDPATYDENGFVASYPCFLKVDKHLLHRLNVLVLFHRSVNQLTKRNPVSLKIIINLLSIDPVYIFVHNGYATTERFIHITKLWARYFEESGFNFNRC